MQSKKKASALSFHTPSARKAEAPGRATGIIIPFEERSRPTAREQLATSRFMAGVLVGALAASLVFLALLWALVVPAMDVTVANAQQAAQAAGGRLA